MAVGLGEIGRSQLIGQERPGFTQGKARSLANVTAGRCSVDRYWSLSFLGLIAPAQEGRDSAVGNINHHVQESYCLHSGLKDVCSVSQP